MKTKISKWAMMLMVFVMPCMLASCSSDDDEDEPYSGASSLYGTWTQTNTSDVVIDITFKSNRTGNVHYTYPSGSSMTEQFEWAYSVDSNQDKFIYIVSDDCQLEGYYRVEITNTTISLFQNNSIYRFKKK